MLELCNWYHAWREHSLNTTLFQVYLVLSSQSPAYLTEYGYIFFCHRTFCNIYQ